MALWDQLPGEPNREYAHFLAWLAEPRRPVLEFWARGRGMLHQEAAEMARRWGWLDRRDAWEIHTQQIFFRVREQQMMHVAEAVIEASSMAANLAKVTNRKVRAMAESTAINATIEDARVPQFARVVGRLTRDLDRTREPLGLARPEGDAGPDYSRLSDEELDTFRALLEKASR